MLYRYWTVRYVPDAVRPDTVGVGVIVADEQNTDSASRFVTKVSDIPNIGGPRKEFLASLNGLGEDLKFKVSDSVGSGPHLDRKRVRGTRSQAGARYPSD